MIDNMPRTMLLSPICGQRECMRISCNPSAFYCNFINHNDPQAPTCRRRACDRCGMLREFSNGALLCNECASRRRRAQHNVRSKGRKFGVEIEFHLINADPYDGPIAVDSDVIVGALSNVGIACYDEGYTHTVLADRWKIVSDASVDCGWELVSPPLRWGQRDQVRRVCQVLDELGAEVSDECGLHVHHDVQDLSLKQIKRLVREWDEAQGLTNCLVSRNRARRGEYHGPFTPSEVRNIESCLSLLHLRDIYIDRYRNLNLNSLSQYGTIEVRQHQGTIDAETILAWVAYGQALITAAVRRHKPPKSSVPEFLDALPFHCTASRNRLKISERHGGTLF